MSLALENKTQRQKLRKINSLNWAIKATFWKIKIQFGSLIRILKNMSFALENKTQRQKLRKINSLNWAIKVRFESKKSRFGSQIRILEKTSNYKNSAASSCGNGAPPLRNIPSPFQQFRKRQLLLRRFPFGPGQNFSAFVTYPVIFGSFFVPSDV
ncbi:hypothetical protein EV146_111181 [Mesobacillus foraminis]|uniref:Uncharacterized protein n=1 Tax=Mesobacillus foraminis TaxID=279826 RepID=A0A4R2B6L3_9BACI|nr:hypothetical protein EV146_111181 [Mesobacillus foraminis]